jgi:Domain of unknown function (DUF1937)
MKLSVGLDVLRSADGYWYLSTPYSLYPEGHQAAWVAACRIRGALTKLGVNCYSPIAETHAVQMFSDICDVTHEAWMDDDRPKMRRAAGLICGRLVSWEKSRGMAQERDFFRELFKPIVFLDP